MSWLLNDIQLRTLQESLVGNRMSSVEYRIQIATRINVSVEIVHNWYRHMEVMLEHDKDSSKEESEG